MCNTIAGAHFDWPHREINRSCKRTQYGWKVFRTEGKQLKPLYRDSMNGYNQIAPNAWDKTQSPASDGFCFFPRKKDAMKTFDEYIKDNYAHAKFDLTVAVVKRVRCREVLATFMSGDTIGIYMKVGICKEFQIIE